MDKSVKYAVAKRMCTRLGAGRFDNILEMQMENPTASLLFLKRD